MILKQYYLSCLAHASYLIADEASGQAAVVDPQRDVEQYLEDARRLGCRIAHVFLTHFHADFLAGHLELRDRTQATIHLGSRAVAEYPFTPMRDGDEVAFGAGPPRRAGDAGALAGVDLDPRLRPRQKQRRAVRGADRGHAVHRRRRPPRPARVARLERRAARQHAVRLAASEARAAVRTRRWCTRRTAPAPCAART